MATFKACVFEHHGRPDGKYRVTVRLTHNRQSAYIKTDTYVLRKQISKDFKTIKDLDVLRRIDRDILRYEELLLKGLGANLKKYSAKELAEYISLQVETEGGANIDFVAFSRAHIEKIKAGGSTTYAGVFDAVIRSLIDFFGREVVYIREITAKNLKEFERFLLTKRVMHRHDQFGRATEIEKPPVKEQTVKDYMRKLQTLFNLARDKYNDEDAEIAIITHDPFRKYSFKVTQEPEKRNLAADDLIKIINFTEGTGRMGLARDVFLISFYFIGMNTADIFKAAKSELSGGRLTYKRQKTTTRRVDEAEISINVEPEVLSLLSKYADPTKKRVFSFYRRYADFRGFNTAVNKGLKQLAGALKITDNLSSYYARHTWATIAANKCDISESDIAIALNHISNGTDQQSAKSIKVTRGYIGKDWSKIDKWHRQVLDYVKGQH